MTDNTGHLRPDRELTNVFTAVVRDMLDDDHGAVKSGANAALLDFLEDAPEDVLNYNLGRKTDYETLGELKDAVRSRQSTDFPTEGGDDSGA